MNGNTTTAHHTDEDLLAALDSPSLGSGAEWQPTKAGDTVIGKILRFEHPVTKAEGRILPIVILEVEGSDGPETLRVAVKHSILRDELLDRGAQIGDRVAIRFLGQPEGKRYFLYRVAVAANGPREDALRFTLEPRDPDELVPDAIAAAGTDEEASPW